MRISSKKQNIKIWMLRNKKQYKKAGFSSRHILFSCIVSEFTKSALSQLKSLSNALGELLFHRLDQGFRKDFINQLDEACEMNTYLIDKAIELESKLPKGLHLVYPNK